MTLIHLKELLSVLSHYERRGSADLWLTGMSANSKEILPGNLFIAKKGKTHDGGHYRKEAVVAGASAILTDLFDPTLSEVTQIIHPHVASIEGVVADQGYRQPSQELFMVGVTGTNGKTTTSFIIRHLLETLKGLCGLIGTIQYCRGALSHPATRTTPDVVTNHQMLREMVNQGCSAAVMEVTSHALDQGRVDHIDFDVALFSNLTLDHLDYHGSMERYAAAKNLLFRHLGKQESKKKNEKWAIVNQDDPWTPLILDGCSGCLLTYGIDREADLRASHIRFEKQRTFASIHYQGQKEEGEWPLIGRFNVYNCLGAMAVALTQGMPLPQILNAMKKIPPVPGRLQFVENERQLKIYVDFAHTDDALKNVLKTLREIQTGGRLLVVFGCGGDRDRTKRPKMAQVCEKYADFSFVTSDNPRSEDPEEICKEIASGFTRRGLFLIEVDRQAAIQRAIEEARLEDILLIAGRGHEKMQEFAHQKIYFDDCEVARLLCAGNS